MIINNYNNNSKINNNLKASTEGIRPVVASDHTEMVGGSFVTSVSMVALRRGQRSFLSLVVRSLGRVRPQMSAEVNHREGG